VVSWKLRTIQSKGTVEVMDKTVKKIRIPRGRITDEVIQAYRNGQCSALARAIFEQTGLPMVLIVSASRGGRSPEWATEWDGRTIAEWRSYHEATIGTRKGWGLGALHAVVRTPDNNLIDIGCWGTPQQWKNAYCNSGPCALMEATTQDMDDLIPEGLYPYVTQPQPNMALAHEFVSLALKRAGYGHLAA
jgi:hypothetical protein